MNDEIFSESLFWEKRRKLDYYWVKESEISVEAEWKCIRSRMRLTGYDLQEWEIMTDTDIALVTVQLRRSHWRFWSIFKLSKFIEYPTSIVYMLSFNLFTNLFILISQPSESKCLHMLQFSGGSCEGLIDLKITLLNAMNGIFLDFYSSYHDWMKVILKGYLFYCSYVYCQIRIAIQLQNVSFCPLRFM